MDISILRPLDETDVSGRLCTQPAVTVSREPGAVTSLFRPRLVTPAPGYNGAVRRPAVSSSESELDRRPDGVSDETVEAVGKLSEALETVERARGALYTFHQLMGHADAQIGEAVDQLRSAGHGRVADQLDTEIVGRNVLSGRWTFQVVEEFDDGYWSVLRGQEKAVRQELLSGVRHVFEAEMKRDRRTPGQPGHGATPA
jgi:hypothetical protein